MQYHTCFLKILGLFLGIWAVACKSESTAETSAYGEPNKIWVVADQALWDGVLGDTLQACYAARYPVLPQPEPIFDLEYLSPEQYTADLTSRQARDYLILADLSDANSPTGKLVKTILGEAPMHRARADSSYHTVLTQDKYARGQLIVFQFAFSEKALIYHLAKEFPTLAKKFREADLPQLDTLLYKNGENQAAAKELADRLGIRIRVPKDYSLVSRKDQVFWLRRESGKSSSNILLKKITHTDTALWTQAGIKALRDSIGRHYISSQLPGTYMRINDAALPVLADNKTIGNQAALEARGIWEMKNDYMSGSFVSYLLQNESKQAMIFADGFVYAPGESQRNWIQQLEYVIGTIRL